MDSTPVNRIKKFAYEASSQRYSKSLATSFDFNALESAIEGPKKFEELIQESVNEAIEQGRREGEKEALRSVKQKREEEIENYFFTIVSTAKLIEAASKKFVPNLTILEFRARCDVTAKALDLYFLIDADTKDEQEFSKILDVVEQNVLDTKNSIAEIFFSNKRSKKIDHVTLKSDYPFVFDLRKLDNALKRRAS